jgi:hypothetical protein
MSALSLEKNGRILPSKRTKHIKVKYFLIKDYYDAGEVDLWYCPTGCMWVDVLTKTLQGQMFRDMQAFLQNCSRGYDDNLERQEDEQAHQSTKQQVATVISPRERVGGKQSRWADGVNGYSVGRYEFVLQVRICTPYAGNCDMANSNQ